MLSLNENHFTDSVRIDFSRPENFNPGPGTYFRNDIISTRFKVYNKESDPKTISKEKTQKNEVVETDLTNKKANRFLEE